MQKRKMSSTQPAAARGGTASPGNRNKLALSSSAINSRKSSNGSPLGAAFGSPGKHGQQRRSVSITNSSFHAEVPNELDRALQMLYTYPIMKVGGTAFENNSYNQPQPFGAVGAGRDAAEGATLTKEDSNALAHQDSYASVNGEVMNNLIKESFNDDGSPRAGQKSRDGMVRLAHALKQAAMWQVILVTVLGHESLTANFRALKLREALQRHLLPTLMKRKEETGSVVNKNYARDRDAAAQQEEKVEKPAEGSFLKEHHSFFQSLNNTTLLQSIAERMTRVRFSSGEIIARPEDPSQQAMYFVVTGKCEMRRDEITADGEGVSTTTKVLQPGDALGGIFGTSAVYGATYRALSVCSMWRLRTEDFESVFRPFADKNMINTYVDALREHATEWLAFRYPVSTLLSRMPIYRYLSNSTPKNRYTEDMEPIVRLRGEVLFHEGDPLGDVYCLLEGHVQRAVKGPDGTYATGVSQILALNDFFTFGCSGRFILLGEEPHILPGVQRYRCLVASRVALLVRIPKNSFINALLDDPTYLIQLREKLQQTYKSEMKLDPVCLNYVPLVKDFPESCKQALAKEAVPLVAGRSVSLCEPAQHVKEVYLLTMGDVRDTRTYGHQPTPRLPPATTTETPADDDRKVEVGRKIHFATAEASTTVPKYKGVGSFARRKQSTTSSISVDAAEKPMEWAFDFHDDVGAGATKLTMTAKGGETAAESQLNTTTTLTTSKSEYQVVNPEEQQELNPPLPLPPAKTFSVTLGGSWEGLLVDKWPYGWETTSTVTAWALPTAKIRTEYNSLPKSLQTSILQYLRLRQKEELGLPTLSTEKLPPMTSYLGADAKTLTVAISGAPGKDEKRRAGRRSVARSIDGDASQSRNSMSLSNEVESTSQQFPSEGAADSTRVSSAREKRSTLGAGAVAFSGKPSTVASPKKVAAAKNATGTTTTTSQKADKDAKKKTKKVTRDKSEEEGAPPAPQGPKATLPHFKYGNSTRDKGKGGNNNNNNNSNSDAASTSEVSPHLLAMYNGEFKNDDPAVINIVRDPVLPPAGPRKQASSIPGRNPPRGDATATQWPATDASKRRWFNDVPSYEPLPGTTQNENMDVEVPTFNSNSIYMTKRSGKAYKENLMNTTNYQASANEGRKEEDNSYVQSHSLVAKRMKK